MPYSSEQPVGIGKLEAQNFLAPGIAQLPSLISPCTTLKDPRIKNSLIMKGVTDYFFAK